MGAIDDEVGIVDILEVWLKDLVAHLPVEVVRSVQGRYEGTYPLFAVLTEDERMVLWMAKPRDSDVWVVYSEVGDFAMDVNPPQSLDSAGRRIKAYMEKYLQWKT